jgi:RNA polymerase sigma-70 factor (ECF subfamily)
MVEDNCIEMKIAAFDGRLILLGEPEVDFAAEVAALFEQHRAPVFRYLLSIGMRRADCDEIVQETFLALFQHLSREKPRTNLRGWIFRVAHNRALKLRGRARLSTELDVAHRCPEPDPEALALRNQRQRKLAAVLHGLPELDRGCLALRAEGFRYRDIAEILGVSLGSVANALTRSFEKLARVDERL